MITKKDLVGEIEGFPTEVVEKMLDRQYEQKGIRDITHFQRSNMAGFEWYKSIEGHIFWQKVILERDFNRFFAKYPKRNNIINVNKSTKVKLNFKL